jgi:hypothetical protein
MTDKKDLTNDDLPDEWYCNEAFDDVPTGPLSPDHRQVVDRVTELQATGDPDPIGTALREWRERLEAEAKSKKLES